MKTVGKAIPHVVIILMGPLAFAMALADPQSGIMPWLMAEYLISAVVSFILFIAMQVNCPNNQETFKVSFQNYEN